MTTVAAVDLGATSGRVIVGHLRDRCVRLEEVARFPNGPVEMTVTGTPALHWDLERLIGSVGDGLRAAAAFEPISVGVDSWGVDYALLAGGAVRHPPFHYRDDRTADLVTVSDPSTWLAQYTATGVLPQAINTSNQVQDDVRNQRLGGVETLLLVPDLVRWWLSGTRTAERTIASTTGLLSTDGDWDPLMLSWTSLPPRVLPPVVEPGTDVGPVIEARYRELGLGAGTRAIAVAGHDTASAVAATPGLDESGVYVSCGTWGLVGVEVERAVTSQDALAAGFTNERGIDGTVRFQRNITGLWILNRTLEAWGHAPGGVGALSLIRAAGDRPVARDLIDVHAPCFAATNDMPATLRSWLARRDLEHPADAVGVVRMIIDSIAAAFAAAVEETARLANRTITHVCLTGGGSQNAQLAQGLADRTGLRVDAGPVEATALGNVLVQARAVGVITGERSVLREIAARSVATATYLPAREAQV